MKKSGSLYLIPVTLGNDNFSKVIPMFNNEVVAALKFFVAEEAKSCRAFLKKTVPDVDFNSIFIEELNEHTAHTELEDLLKPCIEGQDMGLMSEAGCPGIADPGAELIYLAHKKGVKVIPLTGPSSILMALMASGLNGQNFAFTGYLPKEKREKQKRIKDLERLVKFQSQSQFFIETPYRNEQLFSELLQNLSPETKLAIACDLTGPEEFVSTKTVGEWKKNPVPSIHKKPCMFGIG